MWRQSRALYQDVQYSNDDSGDDADDVIVVLDDEIKGERMHRKRSRGKRNLNHVLSGGSANLQHQQQSSADQPSGPTVEFFNPKIRHELEKKDAEYLKRTGLKGAAPGGDAWVWLTSYSRIPVSVRVQWRWLKCSVHVQSNGIRVVWTDQDKLGSCAPRRWI